MQQSNNWDNDKHPVGTLSVITEMVTVYTQMIYTEMTLWGHECERKKGNCVL